VQESERKKAPVIPASRFPAVRQEQKGLIFLRPARVFLAAMEHPSPARMRFTLR
jgi:hypothetical protein